MANAEQYASKDAKKYKNFRHFEFSEESDYAEDNMNLQVDFSLLSIEKYVFEYISVPV